MVRKRDILLGMGLFGVVGVILVLALIMAASLATQGAYISHDSVGVIEITGVIYDSVPTNETLKSMIDSDRIPAIVIRLNTPGGGVSASQEIYETVLKARDAGKIVIASMGSVAASGGYYIAAACDTIMANPGTITGSIGVIANFSEISELLDKIGMTMNVRKSGKFKDTGSISRKMSEEEEALIDGVIMDTYDQFVEAVAEGRNLDPSYVREYADGRIFTGRQARDLGFVDVFGTYQDAIDLAGELSGLGEDPPIYRDESNALWERMMDGITSLGARMTWLGIPQIAYMWSE